MVVEAVVKVGRVGHGGMHAPWRRGRGRILIPTAWENHTSTFTPTEKGIYTPALPATACLPLLRKGGWKRKETWEGQEDIPLGSIPLFHLTQRQRVGHELGEEEAPLRGRRRKEEGEGEEQAPLCSM